MMNDKRLKQVTFLLSLMLLLIAACMPLADSAGSGPTTAAPDLVKVPAATATPVAPEAASATPVSPGATAVAAATATPAATATAVPPTPWPETTLPLLGRADSLPSGGCVVYQNGRVLDEALPLVYAEPDSAATVVGRLGRNRWLPGIQAQGTWYEVRLGSTVTGWVGQSGTGSHGDCAPDAAPAWPVLGSPEAPPVTGCVVYQSGRVPDQELPYVYAGPSQATAVLGQLGRNRWAHALQRQDGWIEIIVGPGATGWILASAVGANGECALPSTPALPVVSNRGAPANERCVAFNPGAPTALLALRARPGAASAAVAQLDNWAEVLQETDGWYQLVIPQGGAGWVPAAQVSLSAGCDG